MGLFDGIKEFFYPSTPGTVGYENTYGSSVKPPTAVQGPPAPPHLNVSVPKFTDAYNYYFYMSLPKEKWKASMDWLTRKLRDDYSQGRFTTAEYNSIQNRVKSLGVYSIGGGIKDAVKNTTGAVKDVGGSVVSGAVNAGSSIANGVSGAANTVGALGNIGGLGSIVFIAGAALLVSKILK